METYIDVFFVVRNVVFLSQSTEVPAFFAGREALFHHFPVYGNAECAFPVLLLPVPVQLVGNARIPAEDIGKEKLYFIYTLGSIEAITFYLIPEGLEQGAVCRVLDFGLCSSLLTADLSPTACGIRLVG